MSRNSHTGEVISQVRQADCPQIGMLDGPPIALNGRNSQTESALLAFQRHNKRVEHSLIRRVLLNRTRDGRGGGGGSELEDRFSHGHSGHSSSLMANYP